MENPALPQPFVAHGSTWRVLLLVAGALGFVAIGLWLAGVLGGTDFDAEPGSRLDGLSRLSGAAPSTVAAVIGWVCVLLFGLFAIAGVSRLFVRGPMLRIDARGVWNKAWSDAVIPWDEIASARVVEVQRQRFVSLDLADHTRYRPTTFAGRLSSANRAFGYGDINIGVTGTDRRFDDMADAFFAFYEASLRQGG